MPAPPGRPIAWARRRIAIDEQSDRAAVPALPDEVRFVTVGERTFVLVGTAHVSRESAELVRRVIAAERPDRVCVELDEQRYRALTDHARWESLDLRQLMRNRQLATLIVNLLLAAYQKRIGLELGVLPGTELLEAVRAAEEAGIPVSLCDRPLRVTLLRAWRSLSFWKKNRFLTAILVGLFSREKISEDDLRRLRERDALSEIMDELARELPSLKRVLIDERDVYLAQKTREAEGRRIVLVIGAGHLAGVESALAGERAMPLAALETIPPSPRIGQWLGWLVPIVILGGLLALGLTKGGEIAAANLLFWILITGIPAAIGAALALAHPLAILTAFVVAPITTLSPVLGAGYIVGAVQAWLCPPRVSDFQSVADEILVFRRWWSNRLLRVFLAFLLPTLGAALGTSIGGAKILSNLF